MIRIVNMTFDECSQQRAIKQYGITKENLISVSPFFDHYNNTSRLIVTFDDGQYE